MTVNDGGVLSSDSGRGPSLGEKIWVGLPTLFPLAVVAVPLHLIGTTISPSCVFKFDSTVI